jgi:hypothetical protein
MVSDKREKEREKAENASELARDGRVIHRQIDPKPKPKPKPWLMTHS